MTNRVKYLLILAVIFWMLIFVGCKRKNYSNTLIVLPNAERTEFYKLRGTDQVYFEIKANYPAKDIINAISTGLEQKGWTPQKEDLLNPGLPSSYVRGWSSFIDSSKRIQENVFRWITDWEDAQGNVVRYMFEYRSPCKKEYNLTPSNDILHVYGIYIPVELYKKELENIEKFKTKFKE